MSLIATLTAQSDSSSSTYANKTGASFAASVNDSSDASYAYGTDNFETVDTWWFECVFSDMPQCLSVESVTVVVRAKNGSGLSGTNHVAGRVNVSGTPHDETSQATTGSAAAYRFTMTKNPATSNAWTKAAVDGSKFGAAYDVTGFASPGSRVSPELYEVTVEVAYTPLPAQIAPIRHLVSKELFDKLRAGQWVTIRGGLNLLRLSMFDIVEVEHIAGPHATGDGWESETWERWPGSVRGIDFDPNTLTVDVRLKGQRGRRALMWDLAYSSKASGSIEDGIAYFAKQSASRSFSRASEATFTNAVGESETVAVNVPAHDDFGLQIRPASGARAADEYSWTNSQDDGGRVWNAAQGRFQCEVNLVAVSGAANQTVAYCYHNASNWAWIYWDGANTRWVFEIRSAGTTYRATNSVAPVAGEACQVGVRWTGSNAENGDAAYTASIFVSGLTGDGLVMFKGTDVNFVAAMAQAITSTLWIGTKGGAGIDPLNGSIRKILSSQEVYTDTEMMRLL